MIMKKKYIYIYTYIQHHRDYDRHGVLPIPVQERTHNYHFDPMTRVHAHARIERIATTGRRDCDSSGMIAL